MSNTEPIDFVTPKQAEIIGQMHVYDLGTIARQHCISDETLEEWQAQPSFRMAMKEKEDYIREVICHELVMEAHRVFRLYRDLQEHMTLTQRISFLASLAKAVSVAVKPKDITSLRDAVQTLQNTEQQHTADLLEDFDEITL